MYRKTMTVILLLSFFKSTNVDLLTCVQFQHSKYVVVKDLIKCTTTVKAQMKKKTIKKLFFRENNGRNKVLILFAAVGNQDPHRLPTQPKMS